jgi:hypothetical protein
MWSSCTTLKNTLRLKKPQWFATCMTGKFCNFCCLCYIVIVAPIWVQQGDAMVIIATSFFFVTCNCIHVWSHSPCARKATNQPTWQQRSFGAAPKTMFCYHLAAPVPIYICPHNSHTVTRSTRTLDLEPTTAFMISSLPKP